MTLDEAIKHCLKVAERYDRVEDSHADDGLKLECIQCAADHRQLAEWLTELKELRRLVDLVAKYAGNSEDVCERYLPSINGDLCVTDGMGSSNCTCCGYEYRCDYKTDIGLLEDVETSTNADVQPVRRGRWIDCTFYDPCEKSWEQDFEFECSNCGYKIYNKPNDNNLFCGHCSARMDGDVE